VEVLPHVVLPTHLGGFGLVSYEVPHVLQGVPIRCGAATGRLEAVPNIPVKAHAQNYPWVNLFRPSSLLPVLLLLSQLGHRLGSGKSCPGRFQLAS
jgi:hypothetical protein